MKKTGFTLIEVMVVVVILGIIVAIASPKFSLLLARSKEKSVLANLSVLRESLRIYYSENATYPRDDLSSLYPKYISEIPKISLPNTSHPSSNFVRVVNSTSDITDSGFLSYVNDENSSAFGSVFIDCSHVDSSGRQYFTY
ncbi:MAG: prepilin-type N-terminal cleavage/methylation domain-containing protein [Elusimicrobiota bacterium]